MMNSDQTKTPTSPRKDVLFEKEPAYGEAIYSQLRHLRPTARAEVRPDQSHPRFKVRKALLDADVSDPNGFERVIGQSDFVSVNFLAPVTEPPPASESTA